MAGLWPRFFSYSRFQNVAFLAVQTHIQPCGLLRLSDSQANERVADLQYDQCPHDGQRPGDRASDRLVPDLAGVAVHQAQGAFEALVHLAGCEHSRQDRAQSAAAAVHPESVQRVVVSQFLFDFGHHEVTYDSARKPISRAGNGFTNPEAGVMATKPATHPEMPPSTLGLPDLRHSANTHPRAPAAAPKCVATNALVARLEAARALPALKPNQPTHSRQAPMKLMTRLCGFMSSCG